AQELEVAIVRFAETVVGAMSRSSAYRVDLGHVFGGGHNGWHWAKRISFKIHVESGDDNAHSRVCQIIADCYDFVVEKLGFVNADHLTTLRQKTDVGRAGNRRTPDFVCVMRYYPCFVITRVDGGLKDLHFLAGKLRPFETSDALFGFTRKHRA